MLKLFLCLCITFTLHPMEQFLMSVVPAAMTGLAAYSVGRQKHLEESEETSLAYNNISAKHEKLKSDLSKSGLLIRGIHQAVLCNPLNTLFNRSIENNDETGMQAVLANAQDIFDINGLDQNGLTALHLAVCQKNKTCIKYLHTQGANPNTPDVFGLAPMHYAAQANDIETMALLMSLGADLNTKRKEDGLTPLTAALKANKQEAVAFLLALKNKQAEIERAPSPDHSVTLLGSLRMALEMQKLPDHGTHESLNLIFHAFLERNPECLICFEEIPTDVYIASCCQKGVCSKCATELTKKLECPFCTKPFEAEPFFIYQQSSPKRICSPNPYPVSSSE